MNLRYILNLFLLLTLAIPAIAQDDDYDDYDEYGDEEYGTYEDTPFLAGRNGAYLGFGVEGTSLKPSGLDPDLGGDMLFFSFQGYILINGWMIGGSATDATIYNLPNNYDEFTFSYGGFQTGYDLGMFEGSFSIRPELLIGGGGITMIKKRRELTLDPVRNPGGNEILERFRDEDFFFLRPGISIGYKPLDFMEFRVSANLFYPVGGESIEDLREPAYGLHLLFGATD